MNNLVIDDINYKVFENKEEVDDFDDEYMGEWLIGFKPDGKFRNYYELTQAEFDYIAMSEGILKANNIKYMINLSYVLQQFTGYKHRNINLYLRKNQIFSDYRSTADRHIESLLCDTKILSNEIDKFRLPYEIVSYRKTTLWDDFKVGTIYQDKGFICSSLVKKVIADNTDIHGDVLFELLLPKDLPCIYVDRISNRPRELELLLQKDLWFEVISEYIDEESGFKIFRMKVTIDNPSKHNKSIFSKLIKRSSSF